MVTSSQRAALAIALAFLGMLVAAPGLFMHPHTGYAGVHLAPGHGLVHRNVIDVDSNSPAYRGGLRTGDVVGCLSERDYTLLFRAGAVAYEPGALPISLCRERGRITIPVTFAPELRAPAPNRYGSEALTVVRLLEYVAFLVCGVVLVIGRPGLLTWLLFVFCLGSGPNGPGFDNYTLLPPAVYQAFIVVMQPLDYVASGALLLLVALLVPGDRAHGIRLLLCRLTWGAIVGDMLLRVAAVVQRTWTIENAISQSIEFALAILVLVALASRMVRMTADDRGRFGWAAFSITWGLVANNLAHSGLGGISVIAAMLSVAMPLTLLYAILTRRVLDVRFALGRTLVFALLSGVVVVSFVLLEWLLGTVLVDASHATGVAANAGLALALGLSMAFLHKRIDAFIDFTFFHERHENERALRSFAREAAFVTDVEVLLDHAIDRLRRHTDSSAAAIFLGGSTYRVARWYGDVPDDIDENDGIVLALKATQKAADPQRHASRLAGELAVPMVARGRLVGLIACGARPSGETYASDEVEALTEFAHGIGTAFAALERDGVDGAREDVLLVELRALRAAFERT